MDVADLRREYALATLDESGVARDPVAQFARWFDQALAAKAADANAMALATIGADGRPTLRIVLLKDYGPDGFVFYTNQSSRKGAELVHNPAAALNFYWPELERQVRIEGRASRVSADEADRYFATRPRGSQLAAWASPQSEPVSGRQELEARLAEVAKRFAGAEVSRPPHWGGYRVRPDLVEFWQGRESRLHDRIRYRLIDSRWIIERLAP